MLPLSSSRKTMKDHVRILVCGDEQVGKSCFIATLVARQFPHEVPDVMTDVYIPPEENDDDVFCTISDCSALPRDRQQLVEKMRCADSIVILYDVQRAETLTHLDTFWLPLIEANTKGVPTVIVRNKVDTLVAEGGLAERSAAELRRQMAPLEERYKFFHISLECSLVTQMGVIQVFHHALSAALYPIAPLYNSKAAEIRPKFDKAMRRLFRIYDIDRDGLLADAELNDFQHTSFSLNLSVEDIAALKRILERVSIPGTAESVPLVVQGGITVEGFVRLMRLFIEKKQMKAPWKALRSHCYDDTLGLSLPPEVVEPPYGKGGPSFHEQVLSPSAESFLLRLFHQFSISTEAYPGRVLSEQGQKEIFSVIPDPACGAWDSPRAKEDEEAPEDVDAFGDLRRSPGARPALTVEGWIAHWQMLALHSPLLARAYLFYVGFKGHGEDMLVNRDRRARRRQAAGRQGAVLEVFVLGSRGCGKSRVIKALRLGQDLLSDLSRSDTFEEDEDHEEALQEQGTVDREEASPEEGKGEGEEQLRKEGEQTEALRDERKGEGSSTEAVQEGQENEWEMVVDSEVPKTCAGFARIAEGGATRASPTDEHATSCQSLSVTVTEVPESYTDAFLDDQAWRCELALLVFDPSSRESLQHMKVLLEDVPERVPRLVISCESSRGTNPAIIAAAEEVCRELELLPVMTVNPSTGQGLTGQDNLRHRIAQPSRPGMLPFAERHRKAKDRKRKIRTAVLVAAVGLAVATGFYVLSTSQEDPANLSKPRDRKSFGGKGRRWEAGVGDALRAPVRVAKRAAAAAADYWRRLRSGGSGMRAGGGGGGGSYRAAVVTAVGGV